MAFVLVYITHKNKAEARKVVSRLLKRRLVACANIFPIESHYRWKGRIEQAKEIVTVLKTKKENWNKVRAEVERIHPYEVPCIMRLDAEANPSYESWIRKETR
ncbi:Divalent-cation tolerance protein CutA [uncultured archaeon]|nr:Divalent-cation tolerance protein CutA [uncultured archaeon]